MIDNGPDGTLRNPNLRDGNQWLSEEQNVDKCETPDFGNLEGLGWQRVGTRVKQTTCKFAMNISNTSVHGSDCIKCLSQCSNGRDQVGGCDGFKKLRHVTEVCRRCIRSDWLKDVVPLVSWQCIDCILTFPFTDLIPGPASHNTRDSNSLVSTWRLSVDWSSPSTRLISPNWLSLLTS